MDSSENKVLVELRLLDNILVELGDIRVFSCEALLQQKIDLLVEYIENLVQCKDDKAFEEIIYDKMKEVRVEDPELNCKLYILYRKLSDGKISEEYAKNLYEVYMKSRTYDKTVY